LLTIAQVKETYGLSRYILMEAVNNGQLAAYRPNRRDYLFKPNDIELFIESSKVQSNVRSLKCLKSTG
jgi:hypothetical protein